MEPLFCAIPLMYVPYGEQRLLVASMGGAPTIIEAYPPYDAYQARTDRDIPAFLCDRVRTKLPVPAEPPVLDVSLHPVTPCAQIHRNPNKYRVRTSRPGAERYGVNQMYQPCRTRTLLFWELPPP